MMSAMNKTIVLITGANQGLGFEVAKKITTENPGSYHVLMGYRDEIKGNEAVVKLQSESLSVEGIRIDITDDASIKVAVDEVTRKYGLLDVLVNNAGAIPKDTTTRQTWQAAFDLDTTSHVVVTEAFLPLLEKSVLPRIVFFSSALGSCAGRNDPEDQFANFAFPAYRASKAAINMVTCHYANMLGPKGWKVNASDPGFCATKLQRFPWLGNSRERRTGDC
ncbi:hypothetical protein NLG97_g3092 [Lecanicillium saksenae]|uniref:Uncharacterized protein n=1 Tax=Lecanicillium saksenae TaxID=468837 RepID=A0ACC1QZ52_9HYPO|nr:hypothetical protein NLG97_g3092 [Lecanicillium saksenae]